MSLPDYLLDPPDDSVCEECGEDPVCNYSNSLCAGCWVNWMDQVADEEISERHFHKGGNFDDL